MIRFASLRSGFETLTNNGGGRYSRTFSNVSTNPQNINVGSSLGGSASRVVTMN
jgi:hypothetical protein